MSRIRFAVSGLLAALAVAAAGCGGGSSNDGDTSAADTTASDTTADVSTSGGDGAKGGTFRIVWTAPGRSIDPAVAYDQNWVFLRTTNDGLVTWRRTGGAAGAEIVPDLATAVPAPEDGGRTYRFEIRDGIRYSDGRALRPSDVPASFERMYRVASPGLSFYSALVGGAACERAAGTCDLSRGVVADDAAGTVTFHLTEPDPDFISKLALPFAYVLPRGTPAEDAGTRPLPATGTYMFESYSPRRGAVLVRNPEFREWSADAQPEGNSDKVEVTFGLTEDAETTQVAQGHANWMMGQVPSGRLAEVAQRTPDQLHVNPTNEVWFAMLNTKVAPFDDVNVRRAVNLAVDRNAVVTLAGGPRLAVPTCQVLPPEFPGYEAHCPYTQDPGDRWTAPDMEEARRLVDASGTRGQRVTLITYADEPYRSIGLYLVSVLRDLGYDARARALVGDVYIPYINNTGNRVQIAGPINWFPDYPAPSNFLNQVLGCNGYRPDSDANVNASQFCEPEIQRQTEEALRVGQTDPEAAAPLWARIDQQTTDLAPWISLYVAEAMDYVSADVRNFVYNPSAIGGFMYELATVE